MDIAGVVAISCVVIDEEVVVPVVIQVRLRVGLNGVTDSESAQREVIDGNIVGNFDPGLIILTIARNLCKNTSLYQYDSISDVAISAYSIPV